MHLAAFAVKAQGQRFVAIDQLHRIGADAFHFLRAQVEAVAQAVFGDHQRDVVGFAVFLEGGIDKGDAVAGVKRPCLVVEHVGEIAQRVLRVGDWRLDCGGARRAGVGLEARRFELLDRVAAQRIELAGGQKGQGRQVEDQFAEGENAVAEPGDVLV